MPKQKPSTAQGGKRKTTSSAGDQNPQSKIARLIADAISKDADILQELTQLLAAITSTPDDDAISKGADILQELTQLLAANTFRPDDTPVRICKLPSEDPTKDKMNTYIERLSSDRKFQNWVKAQLGLNHTRGGLIDFVTTVVETFHRESLSAVNGKVCSQCQKENLTPHLGRCRTVREFAVRPCPKHVCDKLRDIIIENHSFSNPSWKNTHAERWCATPWEMAKCYMPPDGYVDNNTIAETDINGILSVMMNLKTFKSKVSVTKVKKVREIGRMVRHCPELSVEDDDVQQYLDNMIQLLTSSDEISLYSSEFVETLEQLKTETISVSTEGSIQVLQEKDYEDRKSDLKKDLVQFYQDVLRGVIVSPLVRANEVAIQKVYVQQRMENVEWRRTPGSRQILSSYRELFTEGSRNIYIVAEAGAGKTTLMKWLCAEWCCSQEQHEEDDNAGLDVLKRFDFLFLILLTDVQDICDVDGMIERQIIPSLSLSRQYDNNFMERLLHQERCLVLLDGLDEWSHPKSPQCQKHLSIPHRKSRQNLTILSTSRPWKIHSAQLSNLNIDKYVELVNLDMQKPLGEKVISQLESVHKKHKQWDDFFGETKQKGINVSTLSPLMLIQMICLWHDDKQLEKTKCHIYSNIIEFILKQGIERSPNLTIPSIGDNHIGLQIDPPACIKDHEYFEKFFCHMIDLGEFAFKALICEGRAANLQKNIHFFLDIGLLTERRSYEMAEHVHRYCFAHKAFQEYFCALYLSILPAEQCAAKIAEAFTSVERILAFSDVIVFLSGLQPRLLNCLSSQLRSVIADDPLTKSYRRTIGNSIDWEKRHKQMKQLQKVVISCTEECIDDLQDTKIYLEDVFIDNDCKPQSIKNVLKTILKINEQSLKSIKILYDCDGTESIPLYLEEFNLDQVGPLEKLEVVGHLEKEKILSLLSKSAKTLKNLTLCKILSRYGHPIETDRLTPMKSLNVIQEMPDLESLMLESFTLPHSQLEDLIEFISRRHTMKQIALGLLQCSDHKMDCSGVAIDLSEHSCLQMLELGDIPLADVKVNTTVLERCRIGKFDACSSSSLNVLSKVLNCLKSANELQELMVFDFESQEEVTNILKNIQSLEKLQVIIFKRIDLEEERINLPTSVNHIKLCEVQMSSAAFRNIVDRNENAPVKFELLECRITPENEYQTIKHELRVSSHYEIWYDENSQESGEQFVFTTAPNMGN